jgi:hypothetical protein
MTTRSWNRSQKIGTSMFGSDPTATVSYSQNGVNASRAERQARIYKDHFYAMTKSTAVQPQSAFSIVGLGTVYNESTGWFGARPVYGAVPSPDLARAVEKLLEKWRSSTFDAGVSLAEGKESVEMIVQRTKTIIDSARALRKGNFGGALAALAHVSKSDRRHAIKSMNSGYFANAWLELQFGWRPLLNDIYAASEFVKTKPKVGVIRSSVKESNPVCHGQGSFPDSGIDSVVNEKRRYLKVTISEEPTVYERLGLTDPASIAWELVPFSFVVDWFTPIGSTIRALHAVSAMPVTSCCDTTVIRQSANLKVLNGQQYGSSVCRQSARATFDYIEMVRTVSPSLPSAWQIVGNQVARLFTKPLDGPISQLFSSAALVRAQLGRLR